MLLLRDFLYIPHALQISGDSTAGDFVFICKLFERLFALNVIRNYLSPIPAIIPVETTSAVLVFIPLDTASQAIVDHVCGPTEKAFF